jgi:Na+-translocating ferredoxin:NAD+ oxidoreductase RnfD subunit
MTVERDIQTTKRRRHRRLARASDPMLVHGGGTTEQYFGQHFRGAVFPLAAGVLLYGWRVLIVATIVIGTTLATIGIWRRIGRRGRDVFPSHAAWMALLLSLMLPVHLASLRGLQSHRAIFWQLPACGALLGIMLWLLRGRAGTALHATVVVYLLVVPLFYDKLVPHYVLQHDRLFVGDALDAPPSEIAPSGPWWQGRSRGSGHDAIRISVPASESLLQYTLGQRSTPARGAILLPGLLRDRLPPLEDLVMAGHPGPIGASSVIFVIVGGLFMMYRGVIDYRVPLLIVIFAYFTWLVLPIPVAITDIGPRWAWLAMRDPSVGHAVAITFANYELAASPLVFMAFFLATAPEVRPITKSGRAVVATLIGLMAGVSQLYLSVAWGPYLALFLGGLLTPVADRCFAPRPLAV